MWVKSDIYSTGSSVNLEVFNYWVDKKGLTDAKAAWKTWSGRQAKKAGYKSVTVERQTNGDIYARFSKKKK